MNLIKYLISLLILPTLIFCNSKDNNQSSRSEKDEQNGAKLENSNLVENEVLNQPIFSKSETDDTITVLKEFITKHFPNYSFFDYQNGNLNNEGGVDIVLVIQRKCGEDQSMSEEPYCRKVVLLANTGFPKFEILSTNDKLIECSDCGGAGVGDPYQGTTINTGYLSFESLYGSCDKTFEVITFKYNSDKKDWFLYKIGTDDYNCHDIVDSEVKVYHKTKTSKDFGVVKFSDYQ